MWRLLVAVSVLHVAIATSPNTGDELVSTVLNNCVHMDCVKENVLGYLNNLVQVESEARSVKNVDAAIFKRVSKVLKSHEVRFKLPEMLFDQMEIVYSPKKGLDLKSSAEESRGFLAKKKLLFPLLLLLKLKYKALLPIFVAIAKIKAIKALILSKLAIAIVLGFIAYQYISKSGMPMPLSMQPAEPPSPMYGPPASPPPLLYGPPGPSPSPPSSYEPGWQPSDQGGPYARIWTPSSENNNAQNVAYSAYYPTYKSDSTSTARP